jgi:hypothetical protein
MALKNHGDTIEPVNPHGEVVQSVMYRAAEEGEVLVLPRHCTTVCRHAPADRGQSVPAHVVSVTHIATEGSHGWRK